MDNNKNCNLPLVLVFYLDREVMMQGDIIRAFADSVNNAIAQREANCMAFFLPTDGEERIECINPVMLHEADMKKVDQMIQDLASNFDIGKGADEGKDDSANEVELKTDEDDMSVWDITLLDGLEDEDKLED
jgi:hypothetical protein